MQAELAARIFRDWAYSEGLLAEMNGPAPRSTVAEMALVVPITEAGKQDLRSKQILGVGFNSDSRHIIVFTKRVAPTSRKSLAVLPASVDDVSIKYRQGAQDTIGHEPPQSFGGPPYVVRVSNGQRHYACGSSISLGNCQDAGTMGCLVRDANGVLYGLSNNHVVGGCSFAPLGMPIVAPGVHDVAPQGVDPFTLGFHAMALPFISGSADNINPQANYDAAIFRIRDAALVTSFQGQAYDTPNAVGNFSSNIVVEKVGRTTGHTQGKVLGQVHGAMSIKYASARHQFSGFVWFEPLFVITGQTSLFSDHGDSGSLITTTDPATGNRLAVGLVVGGMADSKAIGQRLTLAMPIEPVLRHLNVTLVTGHNV